VWEAHAVGCSQLLRPAHTTFSLRPAHTTFSLRPAHTTFSLRPAHPTFLLRPARRGCHAASAELDGSMEQTEYVPSLNTTRLLAQAGDDFQLLVHNGDVSYAR